MHDLPSLGFVAEKLVKFTWNIGNLRDQEKNTQSGWDISITENQVWHYNIWTPLAYVFLAIWEKFCYEKECNYVSSEDGTDNIEVNCDAAVIVKQ